VAIVLISSFSQERAISLYDHQDAMKSPIPLMVFWPKLMIGKTLMPAAGHPRGAVVD
jgi:hypothetical protein